MTNEQVQLLRDALPVLGTLLGAAVGAIGGGMATWLQIRAESRRQAQRLALELGMQEWQAGLQHALTTGRQTRLSPPIAFSQLYLEVLKLVDEDKLSPETLKGALDRSATFTEVFDRFTEERKGGEVAARSKVRLRLLITGKRCRLTTG